MTGAVAAPPLLEASAVTVRFGRSVLAVDGVSLRIEAGERVGLVGESGSGKTTFARALARLQTIQGGGVAWRGLDLSALSGPDLRRARRALQMVFQDAQAALDPRRTIGQSLREALPSPATREAAAKIAQVLEAFDLESGCVARLPHQLSGGQRQRINLARGLLAEPDLLILDEPVSALDAAVRGRVLECIERERAARGTALLLIGHDLDVVARAVDRVLVMAGGRVVEEGAVREVFERPGHPYTQALLAAVPRLDGRRAL